MHFVYYHLPGESATILTCRIDMRDSEKIIEVWATAVDPLNKPVLHSFVD